MQPKQMGIKQFNQVINTASPITFFPLCLTERRNRPYSDVASVRMATRTPVA